MQEKVRTNKEKNNLKGIAKMAGARAAFLCVVLIWCELIFHFFVFRNISGNLVFPVLFAAVAGMLFSVLTDLFPEKGNKAAMIVLTVLAALWYSTQTVYEHIFKAFLSVNSIKENGADAVGEFYMQAVKGILSQLLPIFLYFVPLIALLVLYRKEKLSLSRCGWQFLC